MVENANPAGPALQLQLLLVGTDESGFVCLRDLLERVGRGQIGLDHARSFQEVLDCFARIPYHMVLCDYQPGEGTALRLLKELRRHGHNVPTAFLGHHVDEATIAAAVRAGLNGNPAANRLEESYLACALGLAIDLYCKAMRYQTAEDTLRKLWCAVEQTGDLVVIADRSGAVEYVNSAFEDVTGYSREEAVGRSLRLLKPKQQPRAVFHDMWKMVSSGKVFHGTVINRKKTGETFVVEKTVTPLRDAEGKITHFVSTERDISERHRLESQLQQAQKMDAIGRLAGGVAHDFNNLLMVISSYAELMSDALATEDPLRRNVTEIMKAAGRAADLTRQLLAFGRKQMQALRVLDLNSVIQEIVTMLPRLIGEDIQLVIVPGESLDKVKADQVQIEQVLMNLAANARDAMPRGGQLTLETANVRLDEPYQHRHSMVPAGDYVMLTVSDVGQGIAPEHLAHIFEPFYTTKQAGKGTGLGLATVYGIIKQSGGFIWVYSEPGLGTTFKIYLPRLRQETRKPRPVPVLEEPAMGTETILLVEDEAAVRASEREFLGLCGYTVLEAENGQDALTLARDYPASIDLVVTDVVMPQLGGAALAERLAAERTQLKVLFVSGYAEKTVLQHGAIDVTARFLQKPFSLKSLARKIREVLQAEQASAAVSASTR